MAEKLPPIPIGLATLRRIAVSANVDPRTVHRVAAGLRVRGDAGDRALQALKAAGYTIPVTTGDNG